MSYYKFIYVFGFISLGLQALNLYAQESKLPPCPSEYKIYKSLFGDGPDERWNNCFGKSTDPSNQTYIGEWKDGLPDGQGLLEHTNKTYTLGKFRRQQPEGYAIIFDDGGNILSSGFIENLKILRKVEVDYRQFDPRLTQKLIDKFWIKYFSVLRDEKIDGYFNCIKTGLRYLSIGDQNSEFPKFIPESIGVKNIEKKCKNFISQNKINIQKISSQPFECSINNSLSKCQTQLMTKDPISGEFIQQPIDKIYELAFNERFVNFVTVETKDGQIARLEAELKKYQLIVLKETERKETERKETERKETERKETERKEAEFKVTKIKQPDGKAIERRSEGELIIPEMSNIKSGMNAYKAQGKLCTKGNALSDSYRETIARRYKMSLKEVRFIRSEAIDHMCNVKVDTARGPIECSVFSVINKKGTKLWMLTEWWWEGGKMNNMDYHCRPHPDRF